MSRFCAGLLALVAVLVCSGCAGEAPFVEQIVIENPTDYHAVVEVTARTGGGWLALATVDAHSERNVGQVYDQGETWIFRFSYSDYDEETRLTRAELVDSAWRVQVPDSFANALRARGVTPPP